MCRQRMFPFHSLGRCASPRGSIVICLSGQAVATILPCRGKLLFALTFELKVTTVVVFNRR